MADGSANRAPCVIAARRQWTVSLLGTASALESEGDANNPLQNPVWHGRVDSGHDAERVGVNQGQPPN